MLITKEINSGRCEGEKREVVGYSNGEDWKPSWKR